jgi:hypothetical protein
MIGLVGDGGLIRLHNCVADDAVRNTGRNRRSAREAAARDKARQRDRAGNR